MENTSLNSILYNSKYNLAEIALIYKELEDPSDEFSSAKYTLLKS